MPQVGGAQDACMPAPPGDCAVMVPPLVVTTVALSLKVVTGAGEVNVPFSSTMSARSVFVSVTFMVADSVGPAVSPLRWSVICTGRQDLKNAAGEVVEPTLATMPVSPGPLAVARPLASTVPTMASEVDQLIFPIRLVMSVAL